MEDKRELKTETSLKDTFDVIERVLNVGKEVRQLRPIVPIETWLNEEYYSGAGVQQLYPYWKRKIIEIFNSKERINEVIWTGSIGTGKTTCATYVVARKLYELSCYFPPQALYQLMTNSKIMFAYFSVNKEVAQQTGFGQLRDLIDTIPYFQSVFKRNEKINSLIAYDDVKMYVKPASNTSDVIGMNLICGIMDEANFYQGDGVVSGKSVNDVKSKAMQMYSTIRARGKSRFLISGEDYTFNLLISSSKYDSSFTSNRIKASRDDKHVFVIDAKLWDVKEWNYSKERFLVFSGNELIDPMICRTVADVNRVREYYKLPIVHGDNPVKAIDDIKDYDIKSRFVKVPIDFKADFEDDLIKALQDIAGVPIAPTGRLFSNRDAYNRALTDEESPFIQEQIVISTDSNVKLWEYLRKDWKPKDVFKPRFIHFDQSTTGDSYGLAQCYVDEVKFDEAGIPSVSVVVEFMLRINPPQKPAQIDLASVRAIVPYMEKHYGIRYGKITYDTFQSAEAVQNLMKNGENVEYQSVEKDTPYLNLCELYYQGRIKHYRCKWYEKELFELVWYRSKGKVDHPDKALGGTKDVADGVCGAVNSALNSSAIDEIQRENDINYFINSGSSNDEYVTPYQDMQNLLRF